MIKCLYANGCSWTAGNEIFDPEVKDLKEAFSSVKTDSYRYYNTWPYYTAQNLDIGLCVNEARGATGNSRIFRKTNDFIVKWLSEGKDPKDLMIMIGWTTPERSEIGVLDTVFPLQIQTVVNPFKREKENGYYWEKLQAFHKTFYELYSQKYWEEMQLRYMLNLRLLCKGLGIKYYDFISIGREPWYWMSMAEAKGIKIENIYKKDIWATVITDNNWTLHEFRHPTKETNKKWADVLTEELK